MSDVTLSPHAQELLPVVYKPPQGIERLARSGGEGSLSIQTDQFEKALRSQEEVSYSSPRGRDQHFFERDNSARHEQQRQQQRQVFETVRAVPLNANHYASLAYEANGKALPTSPNPGGTFDLEA